MTRMELPRSYQRFRESHPDLLACYDAMNDAVRGVGHLNQREVALVKLALSIGAGMEGAAASHARKARESGVDGDALEQVALLALPTLGFPAMMKAWKSVLSSRGEG